MRVQSKRPCTFNQVRIAKAAFGSEKSLDTVNCLLPEPQVLKGKPVSFKAQQAQSVLFLQLPEIGCQMYDLGMVVAHAVIT